MKLITEGMLMEMAAKSREIVLEPGSRLTPSAKDLVSMMGLTIIQEYDHYITRESRRFAKQQPESIPAAPPATSCGGSGEDQRVTPPAAKGPDEIDTVVQKVLAELQHLVCLHPRAIHIVGDGLEIPPFNSGQPGAQIGLANVITSRDANLAAGFMTFDRSELPWEMNYDEVNYVIEGDYVLTVDNQVFRARPGDVLYIPKGSRAVFSSPGFAKVFYATYPANWDQLSKK